MGNRREDRERIARYVLEKFMAGDRLLIGAAAVAQYANGLGLRQRRGFKLVNASTVAAWCRRRMMPAMAGSAGRPVTVSLLLFLAWLHGDQRLLVASPRPGSAR